jgi:hypothetical protein
MINRKRLTPMVCLLLHSFPGFSTRQNQLWLNVLTSFNKACWETAMKFALKQIYIFLLSFMVCYTPVVAAHDQIGSLDVKKNSPKASDIYQISCDSETDHLAFSITNTSDGEGLVSAHGYQAVKLADKPEVVTTTDLNSRPGDASPWVKVKGLDAYYIQVDKTGKDSESYLLQFHCEDKDNSHTETNIYFIQDQ